MLHLDAYWTIVDEVVVPDCGGDGVGGGAEGPGGGVGGVEVEDGLDIGLGIEVFFGADVEFGAEEEGAGVMGVDSEGAGDVFGGGGAI